jgi:uncharacterized OsmC-like protein
VSAELVWSDHLRFRATSGPNAIVVDGDGAAGPSPMQLAAFGLAGCMAADVVAILEKGRHGLTALRVSFSGERVPDPPRRFLRVTLTSTSQAPCRATRSSARSRSPARSTAPSGIQCARTSTL